jgi:hypothetical protein
LYGRRPSAHTLDCIIVHTELKKVLGSPVDSGVSFARIAVPGVTEALKGAEENVRSKAAVSLATTGL